MRSLQVVLGVIREHLLLKRTYTPQGGGDLKMRKRVNVLKLFMPVFVSFVRSFRCPAPMRASPICSATALVAFI
jgi:hypothetical protein